MHARRHKHHVLLWTLLLLAGNATDRLQATTKPQAEGPLARLRGPGGRGVVFSGDGARVVTWDARSAQVWVVATAQPFGPPVRRDSELTGVNLNSDGGKLLTASGPAASVWDAASGKRLQSLWHDAPISSATFDSKGARVLTAGGGKVRLWDAKTGD